MDRAERRAEPLEVGFFPVGNGVEVHGGTGGPVDKAGAATDPEKLAAARHLLDTSDLSMAGVAATIEVSRTTLYRHLGAGDRSRI